MGSIFFFFLNSRPGQSGTGGVDGKGKYGQELGAAITVAAAMAILFILTQDMTGTMVLADGYTLWHGIITAVSAVMAIISINSHAGAQGQEDY